MTPPRIQPMSGRDLEAIVCLMELAALQLTPAEDATFTADELFAMAVEIGGPEITLERVDFDSVLRNAGFIRRAEKGRWRLR